MIVFHATYKDVSLAQTDTYPSLVLLWSQGDKAETAYWVL